MVHAKLGTVGGRLGLALISGLLLIGGSIFSAGCGSSAAAAKDAAGGAPGTTPDAGNQQVDSGSKHLDAGSDSEFFDAGWDVGSSSGDAAAVDADSSAPPPSSAHWALAFANATAPNSQPGSVAASARQADEPTSALTFEAWVVQSAVSSFQGKRIWVAGLGDPFDVVNAGGYELAFDWVSNDMALPAFYVAETASGGQPNTLGCTGHAWASGMHHLAGTFDGATGVLTLWVDGNQACTATAAGTAPFALLYQASLEINFGLGAPSQYPFYGVLDDVRVSNAVLYDAAFTPARHPTLEASTVGLWKMDEGTGDTVHDSSPTHATATIRNFATPTVSWIAEP